MDGFSVFILRAAEVKRKRQRTSGKRRIDGMKNRVEEDAERPSHLLHRSTNHHRLHRRQRILILDRRAASPSPPETFSISHAIL